MIYLQIIVTIFVVLVLFKLFLQKQANRLTLFNFIFWAILWLLVLIVFWQPESTSRLANLLGIGRGADLVVYLSIIMIFYLLFRIFAHLNKIETEITKLTRNEAIKNVEKR